MTGPSASFRQGLIELMPRLRGFARFLSRDSAAADDLVQEALLRALGAEATWQPGSDLAAWIFRILRNAFLEEQRRRRRRGMTVVSHDAGPGTEAFEPRVEASQHAASELNALDDAIRALPIGQREALLLVSAQGFSVEEAAAICGVPEGTIKARISRARAILQRRFSDQD